MKAWLRFLAVASSVLIMVQLLIRIYLQIWPKVTPPICGFLLDSRIRQRYRDPVRTLAPLTLRDGQVALEIGGGTGTFTLIAAQQVAPHGKLISIELQRGMLRTLVRRVRRAVATNILLQQANAMALPLPDASVDAALLIAVLPMVPNKQQVLREVWRVLRPEGLLMVSEEIVAPEYVPPFVTKRWGQRADFSIVEVHRGFWCYTIVFRKMSE